MQRSSAPARCGFAGLILILTNTVLPAAPPVARPGNDKANQPVGGERSAAVRPEPAGPSILQRGIRTYGVGATRIDRAAATLLRTGPQDGSDLTGSPSLLAATRKISGATMAGSVTAFRVSPGGATAVFIADKDTLGRFELYSVPVNGSAAPVKISAALVFGAGDNGVSAFQISPDGAKVVFLADPNTGAGINEIFSVPIDGSTAAVRLNTTGAPVTGFGITRDSAKAVFFAVDSATASGAVEIYRATIGSAGSSAQISDVGLGNPLGDVVAADFSPDSSRVVYAADGAADNVYQWYSVPIAATGPGSDVQISAALSSVDLMRFSPDSTRVVYTADENVLHKTEIFSKPIGGGTRIQLDPSMAGDGVTDLGVSPDGSRVVYLADQITAGANEVFSAQMLVAGSGTRLNAPMTGNQYADVMNITPDGAAVLYEADQNTPGTYELYRAPIDASSGPITLHPATAPTQVGAFQGLGTPIVGRRAVYPVFGAAVDLFSVPYDASSPYVQIDDPLAAGDTVFNVFVPYAATRLMAWGIGASAGNVTRTIVSGPIRSDLPVETLNAPAAAGAEGVLGYEITSDEKYGVYLQDQDTLGKAELYSRELDSDADGVINAADNCPYIANPSQTPVVFPATISALNTTTFTWGTLLDVRFVRGPLASVGSYATNLTGKLSDTAVYVDATTPTAGTGFYYLFAPDCPGRSYQDTPGAEPGRDLAAFP